MQKRYVKLLFLAVFISILVILPDQANAAYLWDGSDDLDGWDDSLRIVVDKATYMDYDNDRLDDDILTIFRIITPENWVIGEIDVTCALEKPSGETLVFRFDVKTKNGVEITLVWFNAADEPGWYTLYISAEVKKANSLGNGEIGPGLIVHEFDPPGGSDVGPPEIQIMSIREL